MQTCRFHDVAKPGINIVVAQPIMQSTFEWNTYLDWFEQHAADFVAQTGLKNIIAYTGHPIVGRVVNLNDLEQCLQKEYLEFENIIF